MENSSYLVKPELYNHNKEKVVIEFIEVVKGVKNFGERVLLETNQGSFVIEVYKNGMIRFVTYNQSFDLDKSFSLEQIKPLTDYGFSTDHDKTVIRFLDISIHVDHHPFSIVVYKAEKLKFVQKGIGFKGNNTYLFINRSNQDFIYGLGEKTGFLNKNNEKTVNWNKDVFEPHTRSNKELYQSINMFSHMKNENKYGLFLDNPSRVTFDFLTNELDGVIMSDIGKFDYYLFTGDTLKEIIQQFSDLSGKNHLPPIWALGYHQSRHSYESIERLEDIVNNFLNRQIPVDAIYLDILYMQGYRVFTFNKETFKGIKEKIKNLKEKGIRIVPIVDPGLKVEEGYRYYDEGIEKDLFCKNPDGSIFIGDVWPGKSAFYDYLNRDIRTIWGENHQYYTDLGIEGIWNDMNEPAVFHKIDNTMDPEVLHNLDGIVKTHQEVHNLYGLGMSMATYQGLKELLNKRPFVLTRAGYAGIQKYAFVWTGDNRSSWEHLEMTLPMCLNLNMSGVSLCGPDIGGFMDDVTEEMLIRWNQIGTFLPFFRNHCSINMKEQEPWQFGVDAEEVIKKYINLRYELIYYIYSEVYKSHLTGIPVMRPLVLEYEQDKLTYSIHDEFLLGSNLLIAPITRPGETIRKVYLPEGLWYNFFTNQKYEGNKYYLVEANIDEIPVFVRGGSILPMTAKAINTSQLSKHINLYVYTGTKPFTDTLIVDDGVNLNEEYCRIHVQYNGKDVTLHFDGNKKQYTFDITIID